jgi:aminotransferase
MLAERILSVERSPFYSILELAAKRTDCLYLNIGEPDFDTPAHIVQAGQEAMAGGWTHYTPDRGLPELRQLLAQKIQKESRVGYRFEDEILITAGGQAGLHTAIMGTVNPGDEVVLLSPYYPPYLANVVLAGGIPVIVPTKVEEDFIPNPEIIERYITDKTKCLVLHSPNNPTGSVYGREVLSRLVELAVQRNFLIISDEVYEKFVYEDKVHWSLVSFPNAKERVILVNSFSKTYAMTGWRVGYVAAPRDTLFQLLKYHHTVNICASAVAQKACVAALQGPQDCVQAMVSEYDKRRQFLVEGLNGIPGIRCLRPQGAFYVFVDIREFKMPSLEFAKYLVQETGVVTTNGSGFGSEGFIRLSYAAKTEELGEAIKRIEKALSRLRKAPL